MKKKNFYKKSIVIILFVVITCITFVGISYLMRPVTTSRKNICGFYAEKKNSIDIVMIGGSVCHASWEPLEAWDKQGFTSYNFSAEALQPQVIEYMIAEIYKTQSPEILVIDLRPFQYGNLINWQEEVSNIERVAPFRNVADSMKYSLNRTMLINQCAPSLEEKWTYHFDIAKYHSALYSFLDAQNWQYIFNEKYLYTKGFEPLMGTFPFVVFDKNLVDEELPLEDNLNEMFISLLECCKQYDTNVLFIVYPHRSSEENEQKYNYMSRIIEEYGYDFIHANEYAEDMGLDWTTDFQDVDHLNIKGADKFTSFFAEYLQKEYNFIDKRNDKEYKNWNEDYLKWSAEMNQVRANMNAQ